MIFGSGGGGLGGGGVGGGVYPETITVRLLVSPPASEYARSV